MRQGVNWSKMCDLAWAWEHRPHRVTYRMKRSYGALKEALHYQFREMMTTYGLFVEWVTVQSGDTELSKYVFANLDERKKMMVLTTDLSTFPDDHPLAQGYETDEPGLRNACWNDIFRAVHDYYGHYLPRQPFSPHGEEMACRYHALSLPSEAIPALINETRCQQAYMLYGVHARQKWVSTMSAGQGRIEDSSPWSMVSSFMKAYPMRDRPFAPQKVVDLGHWMNTPFTYPDDREEEELAW